MRQIKDGGRIPRSPKGNPSVRVMFNREHGDGILATETGVDFDSSGLRFWGRWDNPKSGNAVTVYGFSVELLGYSRDIYETDIRVEPGQNITMRETLDLDAVRLLLLATGHTKVKTRWPPRNIRGNP